jgi:hypothetical protein
MSHRTLGAFVALFFSIQISAAPVVAVTEWKVDTGKEADFVEVIDDLQNTNLGKDRKAQLQLQASSFNGVNPATHRVTILYPSLAEMETWNKKFAASKEREDVREDLTRHAQMVSQYMGSPIQSWGRVSNEDTFWDVLRITATDPATKAFPGQIWLIQVVRGQASAAGRVTHEIAIGYESMAEMESWSEKMGNTKAWQEWLGIAGSSFTIANRYNVSWLKAYEHGYSLEEFE